MGSHDRGLCRNSRSMYGPAPSTLPQINMEAHRVIEGPI